MAASSHNPGSAARAVTVVGGGVAGMSAACALAEAGMSVQLVERRGYLGGRASSYLHPGVGEVIDNCQHVLFGCCTNLIGFYQRIGVADRIHWTSEMTMIEPGGRCSQLGPSWLPAPLHGVPKLMSAHAFTLADKIALARAFSALMRSVPHGSTESLGTWLRRNGQTKGALDRFWRLVIASALNADLDSIALPYAAKVIRELFMNSAQAGSMGMSTVPLSELYAGAAEFLAQHDSRVLLNANVDAVEWDASAQKWTLVTRAGKVTSDCLVLALPFEAMGKLLPHMPSVPGADALAQQVRSHEHWPICSVHLWFDRDITSLDHAVLLDREIHWMYNKSRLQPWRKLKSSYVELVISASRTFAELTREQAIAQSVSELAEFFPEVGSAKLEKAALVKEVRATFGVPPGIDAARPTAVSPWPNCFLAGDWTATGWPSTMESAARSGHLAAEALSESMGAPRSFLNADLKPRGLMRLLTPKQRK
ncbi:MAG: hydroxysqualene dehydroxylase HpnE [Acidobacteriota bacterium]|nr:hydroxysqualene dehydroxylase HpnE [Acidobacteriota bacterium]